MTVSADKVRRILNLANEAHEIANSNARLQHLFSGAHKLVGADVGAMFVFDSPEAAVPQAGFLYGYNPERAPEVLAEYATQGDTFDLMALRLRSAYDGREPVFARRRQELLDDGTWYNSSYVNEFRRKWGFDHSIYSIQRLGGMCLAMSVNRPYGSKAFGADDQALIEIFHLAIARVGAESISRSAISVNDASRTTLAPRARETLDCLLQGASNKEIAERLRLSPNTVHHYCKMVFRAFGVRSRGELLAKWFAGR